MGEKEIYQYVHQEDMKMKEDDVTELKREITKDTMKTVVAFSNTHGGKIYIGVDDKGTVFGVDDTDEVSNYIAQLLAGNVHPDVVMSSEVRTVKIEDKDVIMITVREGTSKPYYLREKGPRPEGVYIRNGPTSVQASQSMILKMVRENSPHTFESALSVDQDLTFRQASRIFQESGSKFGDPQMRSMGLKIADGYTNLAYLLSDQCEQGIKLAVFNDTTKSTFKDRTETYGSVLEQAEEAYRFIDKYNPLRTEITGLRRTDSRAYPEEAVREALINAIIHRDYSVNGSILVSIFKDSMSVSSVGGLNRDIGYDDLMLGISSLRNPRLAMIFYRLGMIEAYGTGIPRIMGSYGDNLTQPKIETSTNVFKITLPEKSMGKDHSPEAKAVLRLFDNKEVISRSDVESALGVSRSRAGTILSELMYEGILKAVGTGRNTRYKLV